MSTKGTSFRRREGRERGLAVLLTAIMLLFVIPAVGLAIDAGLMYVIRGRLTAACDAASLATARNLNMGRTLAEQSAAATVRGNAFFYANFPIGFLGTSGTAPSITVTQSSLSTITVTTTATTNSPLYFMRLLGGTTAVAGAIGKASRRDVNLMLVLDRSGSMAGTPCTAMKTASKTFVNMFVNGRDTVGLVTFGGSTYVAYPPSINFRNASNPLTGAIDLIDCVGGTNTSDSYMTAYNRLVTINEPLALNLIVFFTDGYPTAFAANFPVRTFPDVRYGANGLDTVSGGSCDSTYSECMIQKSTCTDDEGRLPRDLGWGTFAGKEGVVAAANPSNATTGATLGLLARTATSSRNGDPRVTGAPVEGCGMDVTWERFRGDIAYIPATDINGLSTSGYQALTVFPITNINYRDRIRPDIPLNIQRVAMNLADNAAATVRANTNLNVVTYTIGLGGNGGVDDVLLKRMANDRTSPIYDNTKPYGIYVYAPNSSDLNTAFARIASEILRLAQ